jgi:ASC-1-like (ASCH) protein
MNRQSNVRIMRIYKEYFDLIKSGVKTVEVRVAYSSMASIAVGTIIRFNDDPTCERRVTRVARYKSFAEMMQREDPKKINPKQSAEQQLINIRKIFPPDKEQMGVLAFELEKV